MAVWRWLLGLFRRAPERDPSDEFYSYDEPRRRDAEAAAAANAHKAGMNHGGGGP